MVTFRQKLSGGKETIGQFYKYEVEIEAVSGPAADGETKNNRIYGSTFIRGKPMVAVVARNTEGIEEFLRVNIGKVGDNYVATPLPRAAGSVTTLTRAEGIVRIPALSEGIVRGEQVEAALLVSEKDLLNTVVIIGSHDIRKCCQNGVSLRLSYLTSASLLESSSKAFSLLIKPTVSKYLPSL